MGSWSTADEESDVEPFSPTVHIPTTTIQLVPSQHSTHPTSASSSSSSSSYSRPFDDIAPPTTSATREFSLEDRTVAPDDVGWGSSQSRERGLFVQYEKKMPQQQRMHMHDEEEKLLLYARVGTDHVVQFRRVADHALMAQLNLFEGFPCSHEDVLNLGMFSNIDADAYLETTTTSSGCRLALGNRDSPYTVDLVDVDIENDMVVGARRVARLRGHTGALRRLCLVDPNHRNSSRHTNWNLHDCLSCADDGVVRFWRTSFDDDRGYSSDSGKGVSFRPRSSNGGDDSDASDGQQSTFRPGALTYCSASRWGFCAGKEEGEGRNGGSVSSSIIYPFDLERNALMTPIKYTRPRDSSIIHDLHFCQRSGVLYACGGSSSVEVLDLRECRGRGSSQQQQPSLRLQDQSLQGSACLRILSVPEEDLVVVVDSSIRMSVYDIRAASSSSSVLVRYHLLPDCSADYRVSLTRVGRSRKFVVSSNSGSGLAMVDLTTNKVVAGKKEYSCGVSALGPVKLFDESSWVAEDLLLSLEERVQFLMEYCAQEYPFCMSRVGPGVVGGSIISVFRWCLE